MSKPINHSIKNDKVRVQFDSPISLNKRLETYSSENGISKSGAIRMILNQELPEIEETS